MQSFLRPVLIFFFVTLSAACETDIQPTKNDYAAATDSALASTEAREAPADTLAPPRPVDVRYKTYRNQTFGYAIPYPANVFEAEANVGGDHGRSFATSDGSVSLVVYATENGSADLLQREYQQELDTSEQRVTYNVLRRGWYVISGYKGEKVFYQRTILADGLLKTFRIEYPAEEKPYFDPITENLSFNFEG